MSINQPGRNGEVSATNGGENREGDCLDAEFGGDFGSPFLKVIKDDKMGLKLRQNVVDLRLHEVRSLLEEFGHGRGHLRSVVEIWRETRNVRDRERDDLEIWKDIEGGFDAGDVASGGEEGDLKAV